MIHKTLMAATLMSLTFSASANADPQRAQAQANFVAADANQDQRLDMAEFMTFINLNADHGLGRAAAVRRFGMHAKAFTTADANKDGMVSKEEIAAQAEK